jgi:hypothetical protein
MPLLMSVRFEHSCSFVMTHHTLSHGRVTSTDNNGDAVLLLCSDRKVKITLKPKVQATPTFKRTCVTSCHFSNACGKVNSSFPMVICLWFVAVVGVTEPSLAAETVSRAGEFGSFG